MKRPKTVRQGLGHKTLIDYALILVVRGCLQSSNLTKRCRLRGPVILTRHEKAVLQLLDSSTKPISSKLVLFASWEDSLYSASDFFFFGSCVSGEASLLAWNKRLWGSWLYRHCSYYPAACSSLLGLVRNLLRSSSLWQSGIWWLDTQSLMLLSISTYWTWSQTILFAGSSFSSYQDHQQMMLCLDSPQLSEQRRSAGWQWTVGDQS